MPIDFSEQPGYGGASKKPEPFADPQLRRWSDERFHNARFAVELVDGRTLGVITLHPVRAKEILGTTETIAGERFRASSGVLPLHDMASPNSPGQYADFLFGGPAVPPAPGNVPESAEDPVAVHVESNITFSGGISATLFVNGWAMPDELFKETPGGVNVVNVDISRDIWNSLVEDGDGYIHMEFDGTGAADQPDRWVSFALNYVGKDAEFQEFLHREVCFPHRGIGFVKRGRTIQPVAAYQPDRKEPPMLMFGQAWVVKADEPDDVGTPRTLVFGMAMGTPPTIEAIFSAYPAICPGQQE